MPSKICREFISKLLKLFFVSSKLMSAGWKSSRMIFWPINWRSHFIPWTYVGFFNIALPRHISWLYPMLQLSPLTNLLLENYLCLLQCLCYMYEQVCVLSFCCECVFVAVFMLCVWTSVCFKCICANVFWCECVFLVCILGIVCVGCVKQIVFFYIIKGLGYKKEEGYNWNLTPFCLQFECLK